MYKNDTCIGDSMTQHFRFMESVIKASSTEVNLPSHGQVTEGSILETVLLLQLFR